jgi:hypothetical protein
MSPRCPQSKQVNLATFFMVLKAFYQCSGTAADNEDASLMDLQRFSNGVTCAESTCH